MNIRVLFIGSFLIFSSALIGSRPAEAGVVTAVPRSGWNGAFHTTFNRLGAGAYHGHSPHGVRLDSWMPRLKSSLFASDQGRGALEVVRHEVEKATPSYQIFSALQPADQERVLGEAVAVVIARQRMEVRRLANIARNGDFSDDETIAADEAAKRFVREGRDFFLEPGERSKMEKAGRFLNERGTAIRLRRSEKSLAAIVGRLDNHGKSASVETWLEPSESIGLTPERRQRLHHLLTKTPGIEVFSPRGFSDIANLLDRIDDSKTMKHLHSEAGFRALIEGDQEQGMTILDNLRSDPAMIKGLLNIMYYSVVRLARSDLSGEDRLVLAAVLAERYGEVLKRIVSDRDMPPEVREAARRTRHDYLASGVLIEMLGREDKTSRELGSLLEKARSLEAEVEAPRTGLKDWVVPEPLPEDSLNRRTEKMAARQLEFSRLKKEIDAMSAQLELFVRHEGPPEEYSQQRQELIASLGFSMTMAERFVMATMGYGFVNIHQDPVVGIPSTPGLRLIREPGGWLLKADFDTDIQDEGVVSAVTGSIESYWRGQFQMDGEVQTFRTQVSIRRLRPGRSFSPRRLQLIDAKEGVTHAAGVRLALGRNPLNFDYGVPAHEFGHLLGLGDEYWESFDIPSRAQVVSNIEGSLMGARDGVLRPRHFKLATLLLLEESLASPWSWSALWNSARRAVADLKTRLLEWRAVRGAPKLGTLSEYQALWDRQERDGEILDLTNVVRPGIARPLKGGGMLRVQQGSGRFEKLRAGDAMDLFVPEDDPLPDGVLVIARGISGDFVKAVNTLSTRGRDFAHEALYQIYTDGKTFVRLIAPRELIVAPMSTLHHKNELRIKEIIEMLGSPGLIKTLRVYLDSRAYRDVSVLEQTAIIDELTAAFGNGRAALRIAVISL